MEKRVIAFGFVVLLFFMMILSLITPDREYSELEKRNLMQKEEILKDKGKYGKKIGKHVETYLTDQFPERDKMVTIKNIIDIMLGKREVNSVFIGKNHYLIDTFSNYEPSIFRKNVRGVKKLEQRLRKENISSQIILVPAAVEILEDKLPKYACHESQTKLIRQMKKEIPEVVDITKILKKHSNEYIYYRSDHHWTSRGAYYAYVEWKKALGQKAAALSTWKKETLCTNFKGTTWVKSGLPGQGYEDTITGYYHNKNRKVSYNGGNYVSDSIYEKKYLKGKDQYGVFFNSNQILTTIPGGGKSGKLLIVKDSYANTFAQFVLDDYKEIQMIDMRFFRGDLTNYIISNGFDNVLVIYGCSGFATEEKRF